MKKFAAAIAVAVLVAFAAPAFAAINPFMDVPMNHWAYDAIGQLAAHGILSGYPDGTYKGKQPTTRYEMASALARALAVVDMTKASKQDVEMLKRLVIEFKDELEALGVRVDDLDERVSVIESRLGGWALNGTLRVDYGYQNRDDGAGAQGSSTLSMGRLQIQRWFGDPDNPMHFFARLRGDGAGDSSQVNLGTAWEQFYVEVPFAYGATLTAGRFEWDMGADYYLGGTSSVPEVGGFAGLDPVLTGRKTEGLGFTKTFGLGDFRAYLSHTDMKDKSGVLPIVRRETGAARDFTAWELMLMARLQFTEQFALDLGAQLFMGDNAEPAVPTVTLDPDTLTQVAPYDFSLKNVWTIFGGLRFNFMEGAAFKAIAYHQQVNADILLLTGMLDPIVAWYDLGLDSANHWKVIVDVNQDVLKYTSLWLEYGQVDAGFTAPKGSSPFFANVSLTKAPVFAQGVLLDDMSYFRLAMGQQWTPKWGTYLFYYGYDFDRAPDIAEYGLGVSYKYNDNVSFGLNYAHVAYDDFWFTEDDNIFRFRTEVNF